MLVPMAAEDLVEAIRADLMPVTEQLLQHAYVAAFEQGLARAGQLQPFVGEQHAIISSDLRSVAHLVSRFGPGLFLDVLAGERAALEALDPLAAAVGLEPDDVHAYEPMPGAFAYAAYMRWLSASASDAEVAAAYLVNFAAWGESCGRMSRALRDRHGFSAEQVRFFDLFAEPDPDFDGRALAIVDAGLARGVPEYRIERAARMLQGYELLFWDTLLGDLQR
jgi:hypothetical protein